MHEHDAHAQLHTHRNACMNTGVHAQECTRRIICTGAHAQGNTRRSARAGAHKQYWTRRGARAGAHVLGNVLFSKNAAKNSAIK